MTKIVFKKLHGYGKEPTKAHEDDACFDLSVAWVENSIFKQTVYFGIGTDFPDEFFADIRSRSSVHKRWMILSNGCGVIDAGFRGEWRATFYKLPFISTPFLVGERACQFKLARVFKTKILEGELTVSGRGAKGIGSTGK